MNDQKKILFNTSTLWSLKAELLKKQEEVKEKKQLPQHKLENFRPPPPKPKEDITSSKIEKKSFKDNLKAIDLEELEACKKSKAALEKKAELYEHLSNPTGKSHLAGQFLVDFNTKQQQDTAESEPSSYEENENDLEWIEFTDCLGRTRKCHKSDLDLYREKDKVLQTSLYKDIAQETNDEQVEKHEEPHSEKPFLVQKTNDYLHSLREKWEEKERELLSKDKDIHYQDVLYDEARMHGVGYYAFSTDETERRRQMEELMKTREETLRAQQATEEQRKEREDLMASRVAAARARMRARAGLPPEEPKENTKDFTTCLLEFLNQQRNEADVKAKEEEKKKKEEQEIERQKLREAYVREWDIGKDGVPGKAKPFREMTQEEYVEQQRSRRIDEFAPLQATSSEHSDYIFDKKGKMVDKEGTGVPVEKKSWKDVRPEVKTPPPPVISDLIEEKGLYFSTVKKPSGSMKFKNFVKGTTLNEQPTPIVNELSEDEEVDTRPEKRKSSSNHSEIAPPLTYEYYGPTPKHARTKKPFESNMSEAFDQGTQSLQPKTSNRQISKDYDFMF